MKRAFVLTILCSLVSLNAFAATDWSKRSGTSTTIAVKFEQPVESVAVHITGTRFGKCIGPRSVVKVMEFVPGSIVKTSSELKAGLGLTAKAVNGEVAAATMQSATAVLPAVFRFTYSDMTLTSLHYNIVYMRGGKPFALGWRPDAGGGCTYKVP